MKSSNYRNFLITVITWIIIFILGDFLSNLSIMSDTMSIILFLVIIAGSVYFFVFRKFSFVKDAGEIIYKEDAITPFNMSVFLFLVFGFFVCAITSFLLFRYPDEDNTYAIFFTVLATIVFPFDLIFLLFCRKVNLIFTESGILMGSGLIPFLLRKKMIIFYKNIDRYKISKNVLMIYPAGQRIFGINYFVVPLEIVVKDKDRIREILNSKIKHSDTPIF